MADLSMPSKASVIGLSSAAGGAIFGTSGTHTIANGSTGQYLFN
jgi:hypothetical protein